MGTYTPMKGLDQARYEKLLNAPLPNPLPKDAVLVIGADWCPDTQYTLMASGYPTQTKDGKPIIYLNDADPVAHNVLRTLPGREILGGGVDSVTPPVRPTRTYNYPTVVEVTGGKLSSVIYADTVPANGLLDPKALGQLWKDGEPDRAREAVFPKYDESKGDGIFSGPTPDWDTFKVEPNHVYAFVNANCGHCHQLLARADYPTKTEDGRPITYFQFAPTLQHKHFPVDVKGYPTVVTTDAKGKPSIAAAGPDAIIKDFFPKLHAAEKQKLAALTDTGAGIATAQQNTDTSVPFHKGLAEFTYTDPQGQRVNAAVRHTDGSTRIDTVTRNAAGVEVNRTQLTFMPDGVVGLNDAEGVMAPRSELQWRNSVDRWVKDGRFGEAEAREAVTLVAGAQAQIKEEVASSSAAPLEPKRGSGEPAAGSLQDQLRGIGIAMSKGKATPAVIAAIEKFYQTTGDKPMEGLGKLTEQESTMVLNRMQLAAMKPEFHDELRTLGTALGVTVSALPEAQPPEAIHAAGKGKEQGFGRN